MRNLKRIIVGLSLCISICTGNNAFSTTKPHAFKGITLDVDYMQGRQNDTLILQIGAYYYAGSFVTKQSEYRATKNENGRFHFNVPIDIPTGYFTLATKRTFTYTDSRTNSMELIYPQLWESGDSIQIYINHWEIPVGIRSLCKFQGKGAEKYKARYSLQQIQSVSELNTNERGFPYKGFMDPTRSTNQKFLKLEKYKSRISDFSYKVLLADICYENKDAVFFSIKDRYAQLYKRNNTDSADQFKEAFKKEFDEKQILNVQSEILAYSLEYLNYTYRKASAISFMKDTLSSPDTLFDVLLAHDSGKVRDIILLIYFKTERLTNDIEARFKKAVQVASDPESKQFLTQYFTILPGRKLNNYSFTDLQGKKVNLADFDDKIVLMDFYFTGCGGCSIFYKNVMSKVEAKFRNNPNIVFLAISTDINSTAWKEGMAKGIYTSKDALNVYTQGMGSLHPIITDNNIWSYPMAVLLKRGRRLHMFGTEALYSYESLVREIDNLL